MLDPIFNYYISQDPIDYYEQFDCYLTDAIPMTETLIEYIVNQSEQL